MKFNIMHWIMLVVIVVLVICLAKDKYDAVQHQRLQQEFTTLAQEAARMEKQLLTYRGKEQ